MNQLTKTMTNLNIQESENFIGIPNIPKNGYSSNNIIEKSKPLKDGNINNSNKNMIYQSQDNYNHLNKKLYNNNIDSFIFENNNPNNMNFNQNNNSINCDVFNFQQIQFDINNSKNNNRSGNMINSQMHMSPLNMIDNYKEGNINNKNNNNLKNSMLKKNNNNTKSSVNNINSSFTSNASSQLNSQYEILDDENFDNFIERVGENLKHLIKNQKGSRSMQKFLDKIYPEHVNRLLTIISSDLKEIMMDPYGNYFIQKLIQCSSSNQRMTILNTVKKF